MTIESVENAYARFAIASLEVCYCCEKVSECLQNGDRMTGWDPKTMKSIRVPLWFCWECLGDTEPEPGYQPASNLCIPNNVIPTFGWEADENP